eukprot:796570_1
MLSAKMEYLYYFISNKCVTFLCVNDLSLCIIFVFFSFSFFFSFSCQFFCSLIYFFFLFRVFFVTLIIYRLSSVFRFVNKKDVDNKTYLHIFLFVFCDPLEK